MVGGRGGRWSEGGGAGVERADDCVEGVVGPAAGRFVVAEA